MTWAAFEGNLHKVIDRGFVIVVALVVLLCVFLLAGLMFGLLLAGYREIFH